MEDDSKTVTLMSSISFISEIMLVFVGLSGVAVVGVHIGYFHSLTFLFIALGLTIGILAILLCLLGVCVILYHDYHRLKLYLSFFTVFLGLQLAFIINLYFITHNLETPEEQQASILSLDVCFGFTASALIALCFYFKQKGSTIEMVKL